jgi:hypothetical protein
MHLPYNDPCGQSTMQSVIEPHPSRDDVAIQNFNCGDCGPVKSVVLSLKPSKKPSPNLAV